MLTYDKMSALSVGSQDQLDGMASFTCAFFSYKSVLLLCGK